MNVEIGAEAAQFPEKVYINEIAIAVRIIAARYGEKEQQGECFNASSQPICQLNDLTTRKENSPEIEEKKIAL
jgi:hypothetical protein